MIETLIILAMTATAQNGGQLAGDYAKRDYVCQANGEFFNEGETACLDIPGAPRLARCETVLNNSSWTPMDGSCRPGEPVGADTDETHRQSP